MKRRPAGSGTVFLPTKVSRTWWIAYRQHGRTVRESAKTTVKPEAEALLRKRVAARDAGAPPPATSILTVAGLGKLAVADQLAHHRKTATHTAHHYARMARFFGATTPARDIDERRIAAYIALRTAEKAAPGTIDVELSALRRGFILAVEGHHLERRPRIRLLNVDNARQGFFEAHELAKVLPHLPEYLRPVMEAAYETGWRLRSELLTRQWRHVDLKAGWLRLEPRETKNGKGRMFPLTPALKRILEAQRAHTTALEHRLGRVIPWVFHREGHRVHQAWHAWNRAREAAGMPEKLMHDFRRTAVRNLERAAVSRSAAMALVGHLTEAMYRRYAIVSERDLVEAGKRLARLRH
jgi:integrase/recombinase XerD